MAEDVFKDEFAHTVLHKRDVFKELKKAKKSKSGKSGILSEEIAKALKDNKYAPKDVDKGAFDSAYGEYVDHVTNSRGKPDYAENAYESQQMDAIAEEEDDNLNETEVDEAALAEAKYALMGRSKRAEMSDDQKEIDRYCNMPRAEFFAEMMSQFGEDVFNQGFDLLTKNKTLFLADSGPAKLDEMMSNIIGDKKDRRTFNKICGQYIVITGMKI